MAGKSGSQFPTNGRRPEISGGAVEDGFLMASPAARRGEREKMSESKQNDTSTVEVSEGTSPLSSTPRPQVDSRSVDEELRRGHREWLEKAAASFQRMAVDPKYREERSKMGF
jgi:hypothetical protein